MLRDVPYPPEHRRPPGLDGPSLLKWIYRQCIPTSSGCLVWDRSINRKHLGGGKIYYKGKIIFVHRLIFFLFHKRHPPRGTLLVHTCHNTKCVNVEHLEPMTPKQKTQFMMEHGRHVSRPWSTRCAKREDKEG